MTKTDEDVNARCEMSNNSYMLLALGSVYSNVALFAPLFHSGFSNGLDISAFLLENKGL
jgi:hypothetical protein